MKRFLSTLTLLLCFAFTAVNAQDNYDATTMGNIVRYYETAKWAQGSPFNNQCWTNATQQTHAKTGCVPTAFAIIMRHHGFPAEGIGTLYNQQTGEVFTDRTYDYSKMPLTGASGWTTEQQNEVAKLMAHLGHAFGVSFGQGTTSVSIGNTMSERMQKFFNYNYAPVSNQYADSGQMYDFEEWKKNLKNSLDNGCPVPYAADNKKDGTNDTRHMFVIDGYTENEYFHFNFGWGGGSNGWYKLDNITPTGDDYSWRTTSDGYDSKHQAFFNLMPNKTKRTVTASVSPTDAGKVTVNGSENSAEVIEGTTATLDATANNDYTFSHWSKGGVQVSTEKTYKALVAAEGNDYVANFLTVGNTTVNVSVSYNSSYGTVTYNSNAVSGTGLTPYLNSEVTLVATPLDGYVFNGWTVTKGTNSTDYSGTELTFVATEDMSVEANFSTAEFDYTFTISDVTKSNIDVNSNNYCSTWTTSNGVVLSTTKGLEKAYALSATVNTFFASAPVGSSTTNETDITFTLTAPAGYEIKAYNFKCKSASSTWTVDVKVGENTTNVTNASSGTIISASNVNAQSTSFVLSTTQTARRAGLSILEEGITVTLEKISGEGGGSTPTPDPTPITYNITAEVSPQNAGKVAINGGTQSTVANIDAASGSTVSLEAYPNSGYRFVNWTLNGNVVSTDASYTFNATAAGEYVANFEIITYTISATANPGTAGSVTINDEAVSSKNVNENSTVTLVATPQAGYCFVNWTTLNGNVVSTNATYSFTATEITSLVAKFEQIVVNVTLTDSQGNQYIVKLDGFTNGVTKETVAAKLKEAYPYITLGTVENVITLNGSNGAYTYTNTVELPFKVSNATYIWHNIYYPANSNDNPNYIAALNEDEVVDMAASKDYAYGDNPTYNTKDGGNSICWAIYNVNNSFEFIFKSRVTNKYIKVESVSNSTTQNVKFVENAKDATAFTLLVKETVDLTGVTPAVTGDCDFALVANIDETTGYLCATSSDKDYVTHFDRYNHRGAWVKFVEAPDYFSKIMDMGTMLGYRFGAGDSKCVIAGTDIEEVDNAMQNSGSITLNKLNDYAARMEAAMATENPTWFNVKTSAENGAAYITLENDDPELTSKRVPGGYELTVKATPATGYHFTGWTMNGTAIEGDNDEHTFTVTEATTIVASFAINTYTVNVTAGENGSVTASTTTVEHGGEVTLTAVPNDGYEFAGWYNGETKVSDANPYTFPVTSVINYTARFEEEAGETPTTYAIRIETEGLSNDKFAAFIYTGITQDETQKSYELGSAVKLIAVQDNNDVGSSGYAFVGWFLGETLVSENDEFDFKVTGDVTYKAKFVEGIRVSVRAERGWPSIYLLNSDKEVGGTSMSTLLVPGRQLKLSVNPEFGCRFVRWTVGDNVVSTENPFTTEPLNETVTFKAICEPASYQLTVRANNDGWGTVSATSGTSTGTTIQVGHNMDATITAVPAEGYRFVEWTKGTDVVSTETTYTIDGIEDVENMADAEYIANFVEVEEVEAGTYYRIAYDFEAPVAAKTAATRAVGDVQTYVVNGSTGTAALDSYSKTSRWSFIPNGELLAELTLEATANVQTATTPQVVIETKTVKAIQVDGNYLDLCTGGWTDDNKYEPNKVTFTLSVQNSGYQIVGYDIECKGNASIKFVPTGAFLNSNSYQVFEESFTPVTEHSFSFERDIISTITVKSFNVYIQPVGGESEGGGETPEPEPETVRYYMQSVACGVSGGNNLQNALKMTQETGAASIFYYTSNKLMSYATGTYVNENGGTRGLQNVGVEGGDVTFESNKIKFTNGTNEAYLHAVINQNGTSYVDHCGSNPDNHAANHNFVLEEVESLPVTITDAGYATWYAPVAVQLPEGLTAYTITIHGDYAITGKGFKQVPANTGVILEGTKGTTYELEIIGSASEVESIMKGTVAAEILPNESAYVLSTDKGTRELGFYMANDGQASWSHKAYLPKSAIPADAQLSAGFRLILPGTTVIEEVETENNIDAIYDLTGRKLEGISGTGIYIINGKKVIVR